jgi:hypothetical protein
MMKIIQKLKLFNNCLVTACAVALVTAGCVVENTPLKKPEAEKPPALERVDELFALEEGEWGEERIVFRTNDEKYWKYEGMTVWTAGGTAKEKFEGRKVVMGKPSGYSGGGYGIVICQGEYEVRGKRQPVMLAVMVNNEGQYIIGKAVGGAYEDYGWWKTSPYLQRGMGVANEIKVSYEEESLEYVLEINGYEAERFRDEGEPALNGGKDGYIVVITPYDKFPESEIDVYFEEKR